MLLAAGCGGEEPRLPKDLAGQLAARSDATAAQLESGEACAARKNAAFLQARAIGAINAGRVPADLQEELLGRATALLETIACPAAEVDGGAAADAGALADWLREKSG